MKDIDKMFLVVISTIWFLILCFAVGSLRHDIERIESKIDRLLDRKAP